MDDLLYGCGAAVQQVLARNHLVIEEQRAQPIDDETEGLAWALSTSACSQGVDLLVGRDASHDIVEARRVELMVQRPDSVGSDICCGIGSGTWWSQ